MNLKRLIEDGERQLAECNDPVEREVLRARLFNNLCRRYPQFQGLIEIDGELLKPVSRKDVEDKQIDIWANRDEDRDAGCMAEEGCYTNDDGEGEPTIRGMMKGPTSMESGQTFEDAPDVREVEGIVDPHSNPHEFAYDVVSQGGIWESNIADDATPDEYGGVRVRSALLRDKVGHRKAARLFPRKCEMCLQGFQGTQNARYCNICKSPKYTRMRKLYEAQHPEEKPTQPPTEPIKTQDVRLVISNFLRHGEKTTEELKADLRRKAGVDVTEGTD
jgi:hypothetical protein